MPCGSWADFVYRPKFPSFIHPPPLSSYHSFLFLTPSLLFPLCHILFSSFWFLCSVGISLHSFSKFLFCWSILDKYRSNMPIQGIKPKLRTVIFTTPVTFSTVRARNLPFTHRPRIFLCKVLKI